MTLLHLKCSLRKYFLKSNSLKIFSGVWSDIIILALQVFEPNVWANPSSLLGLYYPLEKFAISDRIISMIMSYIMLSMIHRI